MTTVITSFNDVIDSRDIIERIAELEAIDAPSDDEASELEALRSFASEASDYSREWHDGATLIRESFWVDYVQDLLEDCGDVPANLPFYVAIDWETTARNIASDYTLVDFEGINYYIRSC